MRAWVTSRLELLNHSAESTTTLALTEGQGDIGIRPRNQDAGWNGRHRSSRDACRDRSPLPNRVGK